MKFVIMLLKIFYYPHDQGIVIVRIVSGYRDLDTLF